MKLPFCIAACALLLACDDGGTSDPTLVADGATTDATRADSATQDSAVPDGSTGDAQVDRDARVEQDARIPTDAVVADALLPDAQWPDRGPLPDIGPLPDAAPPPDAAVDPGANPLLPRAANATCRLPVAPAIGSYRTVTAFPNLRFQRPLWIGTAPGEPDALYVAEQGGRVLAFDNDGDVGAHTEVFQLPVNRNGNEEGLLGLAFHPNYAENGRLFVYYTGTAATCPSGAGRCSIISEFTRNGRRSVDPQSERKLWSLDQPFSNHNGGDLRFGPDGYLYVGVGDGGSAGDPLGSGQDTNTQLGAILRIDIDGEPLPPIEPPEPGDGEPICENTCQHARDNDCDDGGPNSDFDVCLYGSDCADCGPREPIAVVPPLRNYAIPPGNPFENGGGDPAIWAWGLRNPWRMAFDPSDGALWVGDVGQNAWEEVDKITEPGNFGWKVREGLVCYNARNCADEGFVDPVHVYPRGQGVSISGGLVYRGERLPELWGAYVFGDYGSGKIWSLRERAGAQPEVNELATFRSVVSFGSDAAGQLLLVSLSGTIAKLERVEQPEIEAFPQRLSETGCFANVAAHQYAAGVVPFTVNAPLWSDGADKLRAFALPDGEQATRREDGALDLPVGSITIKTFSVETPAGNRRLETRMMHREPTGWRGFTWRWNEAQDDAELVGVAGRLEPIETTDGALNWQYPSRSQCDQCHTPAANFVLGLRPSQLDRAFDFGDGVGRRQLDTLIEAGYIGEGPAVALAQPGADGPVGPRARAWLESNCANCHQPNGPANAQIDLRAATPLADTGLCAAPTQGDLGIGGARLVAPGNPGRSVLLQRVRADNESRMPPIGVSRPDPLGSALLDAWIEGLESCP